MDVIVIDADYLQIVQVQRRPQYAGAFNRKRPVALKSQMPIALLVELVQKTVDRDPRVFERFQTFPAGIAFTRRATHDDVSIENTESFEHDYCRFWLAHKLHRSITD